MTIEVRLQQERFDVARELALLEAGDAGAVASFTGIVRGDDDVEALELEHYPGMTEKALTALAEEASERWAVSGLTIVHRVGKLQKGEPIVFVGTASAHRADAIEAMHFLIDRLKTDAPFWKREHLTAGGARWVEARQADEAARRRWM